MEHQIELAYLGIEVPDPTSLTPFFADVVGLLPGEPGPSGTVTWRNDDKAHRVDLETGPKNDATCLGFEAVDEDALEWSAWRLADAGFAVHDSTDDERSARRVKGLLHTEAPWGVRVELALGREDAAVPYASPLMPHGFLTNGVGSATRLRHDRVR